MSGRSGNARTAPVRPNKAQRQHRIARLLEEHRVTNQAHLVELLAADGVDVNVSTVSRDLEELGAIKVRIPGGETAYAVPELPKEQVAPLEPLVLRPGENLVDHFVDRFGGVLRAGLDGVLGTIAGDDTLLLISSEGDGPAVADRVHDLAGLT